MQNIFHINQNIHHNNSYKPPGMLKLMNNYSLRCLEITPGSFSGELNCHFNAYVNGMVERVCPPAPKGYVNKGLGTVRLKSAKVNGDRTEILFPIGGSGEFEPFTVTSGLVKVIA